MTAPAGATAGAATVDLQVHSTASDGSVAPADIPRVAAAAQLSAFALTDHDSIAGVAPAAAAAAPFGIRVIPGVELSAYHADREVHMLGLHIADLALLDARLADFRARRAERAVLIVGKLRALGVDITVDEVQRQAGEGALGRPHVARALVAMGTCVDFRDAFDRFLGSGRVAFVPKPALSVADAIKLIHGSGGLAIWAHPGRDGIRSALETYASVGMDGAEVLHPGHNAEDVARLRTLCDHLGLLPSGGSDWHGESAGFRTLGAMRVPIEWLERQEARVAERRAAGRS